MTHRTSFIPALATALMAVVAAPAFAQADLAQKKNCMACHAVDKKVLGPAYKDVAAKYAGQKDAVDKLAAKVMKGGAGVWATSDAGQHAGHRCRSQTTGCSGS